MLVLTIFRMPAAASMSPSPSGSPTCVLIAAEDVSFVERAEQQVGVGDRRQFAAAPITGRTRRGARALRPDLQQAVLADPGDGAAAGAQGADGQHRRADVLARDTAFAGLVGAASRNHADVGAGAAHVEGHDLAVAAEPRHIEPRHDARRRARQQRLVGKAGAHIYAHQSAVGLHQEHLWRRDTDIRQAIGEPRQVAPNDRSHIGVDHSRRQPRIFADHGQHARGHGNPPAWGFLRDDGRRPFLVLAVLETEQVADGERLHPLVLEAAHRRAYRVFVQILQDLAGVIDPPADIRCQRLRREQGRLLVERVHQVHGRRLRPAARLVHSAESLGDEKPGADALTFQNSVRRHRGPVHQGGDLVGLHAGLEQFTQGVHHRVRGIRRVRRHLGDPQFAAAGFEGDQVRERAARIDPHHPRRHVACSLCFHPL